MKAKSIAAVEQVPFYQLEYKTSGKDPGKPIRKTLGFHLAKTPGLVQGEKCIVLASDLQGREIGGSNRLVGERVAYEITQLVAKKQIPPVAAVILCGDLYEYEDFRKRGGTGSVFEVYDAISKVAEQVVGVLGNHDVLESGAILPSNVTILDGSITSIGSLSIGGVGGIIGDPKRHLRKTEEEFLKVMEKVTRRRPDILLLHQGPEDAVRGRRGNASIALSLETGYRGLTVFGHTHWEWPFLLDQGDGQSINVDGRVVVVTPS